VLRPDQHREEGIAIARELMVTLGIKEPQLIEGAYVDLQENRFKGLPQSP
jgi:hypothetical protein